MSVENTAPLTGGTDNKTLVKTAMIELFVQRDTTAVDRYWSNDYVQHNPTIPNGREALPGMIEQLPEGFNYEPGMIVADGDIVMIHGRYTGLESGMLGDLKKTIAVDIFRVAGGKLVEHWDVLQEEVPPSKTKTGNSMFELGA